MQKGGNHTFLIVSSIADGTFKNHFYTILYMYVIHSDKASIHPLSLLPLFPISWCFFPPSFHPTITSFGFASVFPLWFSVYPGLLMWARMCSYQLDQLDQESVTPGCITGKNDSPPPFSGHSLLLLSLGPSHIYDWLTIFTGSIVGMPCAENWSCCEFMKLMTMSCS